jgi:hypothetical protein
MKKLLGTLACAVLAFGLAVAQEKTNKPGEQGLKVEKIVAATSVADREPVGESKEFEASVGKVYCWTKIVAKTAPARVKHVWYADDEKVFEQTLEIKYPSTRTWSCKSVKAGKWRVDVTDEAGAVVSSVGFAVR